MVQRWSPSWLILVLGGAFGLGEIAGRRIPANALPLDFCTSVVCIVFFHNHHFVVRPWPGSAVTIVFQMFICKQAFFVPVSLLKRQNCGTNGVSREQFKGNLKTLVRDV